MEATLRELCKQHSLTAISVLHQFDRYDHITVYLHWRDGDCVSGGGDTFDEAMAIAVAEMNVMRDSEAREHVESPNPIVSAIEVGRDA